MGDVLIQQLLQEKKKLKEEKTTEKQTIDYLVASWNDELYPDAIHLAKLMRDCKGCNSKGIRVHTSKKMKQTLNYADKIKAKYVVLIAPNEWAQNKIKLIDMFNKENGNEHQMELDITGLMQKITN